MTIKAEAQELPLDAQSSDQKHDDGALNNQVDFDAAFDSESAKKNDDEVVKPIPDRKPAKEEKPIVEPTPVEEKVLTISEKAEAAAKALEEKPAAEAGKPAPASDIMDAIPPQYAWARAERDNGKLAEWIKGQPKAVQKAANSGDVDDAVYVLDLYKQAQQPSDQPTKAQVKSLLAEYGDTKFTAPDGTEKTLKAIAEEYGNPELFEAFAAMNRAMLGNQKAPVEKPDRGEDINALQQKLNDMREEQAYWEEILEVHSDGKKLAKSGKVKEWVDTKAPDSIKRLMKSPVAEHGILVLDAYKEAMASEAKDTVDQKAVDRKKQVDGLHGESIRQKRDNKTFAGESKEEKPEAFDEGFEAATKK